MKTMTASGDSPFKPSLSWRARSLPAAESRAAVEAVATTVICSNGRRWGGWINEVRVATIAPFSLDCRMRTLERDLNKTVGQRPRRPSAAHIHVWFDVYARGLDTAASSRVFASARLL